MNNTTENNSEYVVRPGYAVSYMTSAMAEGKRVTETFFEIAPDDEALAAMTVEDAEENLKRLEDANRFGHPRYFGMDERRRQRFLRHSPPPLAHREGRQVHKR